MTNIAILTVLHAQMVLGLLICGIIGRLLLGGLFGPHCRTAPLLMAPAAGYAWLGLNALWMARCGLPAVKWSWLPALLLAAWAGGAVDRKRLRAVFSAGWPSWLAGVKRWLRCPLAHPAFSLTAVCGVVAVCLFPHWRVVHSGADDFHHAMMVRLIMEAGSLPPVGMDQTFLRVPYHFPWHLAAASLGRLGGVDPALAAAAAAKLSGVVLILAVGGMAHLLGRSRFSAGAAMALAAFTFTYPNSYALVGRWPFSVALAGMLVLAGLLTVRLPLPWRTDPVGGDARSVWPGRGPVVAGLLFGAVACVHARQAVWCGMLLGLLVLLTALAGGKGRAFQTGGQAPVQDAGGGSVSKAKAIRRPAAFFSPRGRVTPWLVALAGGSVLFLALNLSVAGHYSGSINASADFRPPALPLAEVLKGGCPEGSGLILPVLALLACLPVKSGPVRRRLLLFLAAWLLAMAVVFKGNLKLLDGPFFMPENAKLQNPLWMIMPLALGADALRKRWWFRGQSRARLAADALAGLAVLCWLRPPDHTPDSLRNDYFPVATVDDARCLRRLAKAVKKRPPGMLAVPAARLEATLRRPVASGAGGWAPLYLPAGWRTNALTFYHFLACSPEELDDMEAVGALMLNPPAMGTDTGEWFRALKARGVKAVFTGEIEALRLYEEEREKAAAALERLPEIPGLKVMEKAGKARVYEVP